jgi:dCMP deaminase
VSLKQAVLYLPVMHSGYEAFLERHSDSAEILILGSGFRELFPAMSKEIRALAPERAAAYARISAPGSLVRLIDPQDVPSAITGDLVVMPDEEIMHTLAGLPDFPRTATVQFDRTFLRWDRKWSQAQLPADFDGRISRAALDREFMREAQEQSTHSSDWWRQVGAVAARDGRVLRETFNRHLPTEYAPYIDGDPRNEFRRGIRADLSTAIHAEAALIAQCARDAQSLDGADLYVSTFPCPACARLVAEAGFSRCFFAGPYSVLAGQDVLRASGIELIWVDTWESMPDDPASS